VLTDVNLQPDFSLNYKSLFFKVLKHDKIIGHFDMDLRLNTYNSFTEMHEKFMDLEFRSAKIHGSENSQCSTTESTQPETEKKKVLRIQKTGLLNH
jgi:hypothetical protein